jgi:hypothetical protein
MAMVSGASRSDATELRPASLAAVDHAVTLAGRAVLATSSAAPNSGAQTGTARRPGRLPTVTRQFRLARERHSNVAAAVKTRRLRPPGLVHATTVAQRPTVSVALTGLAGCYGVDPDVTARKNIGPPTIARLHELNKLLGSYN